MNNKKKIHYIFILLILLIASLIASLTYQSPITPYIIKQFDKPIKIIADDECSLIMGKIIHQIRDSDECNIRCFNECMIRDKKFIDLKFISRDNSCHTCECYCK